MHISNWSSELSHYLKFKHRALNRSDDDGKLTTNPLPHRILDSKMIFTDSDSSYHS